MTSRSPAAALAVLTAPAADPSGSPHAQPRARLRSPEDRSDSGRKRGVCGLESETHELPWVSRGPSEVPLPVRQRVPACRRLSGRCVSPTACQGGSERPCSGNGRCSGDGSRQGNGSCQCHPGYQGPTCTDCMDGYFSSLRNETHSVCTGTLAAPAEQPGGHRAPFLQLPAPPHTRSTSRPGGALASCLNDPGRKQWVPFPWHPPEKDGAGGQGGHSLRVTCPLLRGDPVLHVRAEVCVLGCSCVGRMAQLQGVGSEQRRPRPPAPHEVLEQSGRSAPAALGCDLLPPSP